MKTIRFKSRLLQPADEKRATWSFLVLPKQASARLSSRGSVSVTGTLNGHAFKAVLEPDGQRSHWLKVSPKMRQGAGAEVGDWVALEISPADKQLEAKVPADLRKALAASARAKAVWADITPIARRDWVQWITSAKQAQTRARRISNACNMLAAGKRRVCCFDRSGYFSNGLQAPKAAPVS